jgi:hypothetical protein
MQLRVPVPTAAALPPEDGRVRREADRLPPAGPEPQHGLARTETGARGDAPGAVQPARLQVLQRGRLGVVVTHDPVPARALRAGARRARLPAEHCRCTTEGATFTYPPCATPCEERLCEHASCQPILRRGGILDFSGCYCNRTSACGFTSPPTSKPPLCRPLVGPTDRRIRDNRAGLSASLEVDVDDSSTEKPEDRCE